MTDIKEDLKLHPLGLKPWQKVDKYTIYSNDKICDAVLDWCKKARSTQKVYSVIEKGILSKKISVGYTEKKLSYFIKNRVADFFKKIRGGRILGFYNNNKLAIVLDKNLDILGNTLHNIPPILNHEIVHYIADTNTNLFLQKTSDKYLIPFYYHLFKSVLQPDFSEDLSSNVVKTAIKNHVVKLMNMPSTKYNDYINLYKDTFSKLGVSNEGVLDIRSKDVVWTYMINILDMKKYPYGKADTILDISDLIIFLYKDLFNMHVDTNPGQEIVFPDEIISILSEFDPPPEIVSLINSAKF